MTPARWQQIESLFAQAVECPDAARPALLDRLCAGDTELRRELESLLSCDAPGQPLLEIPDDAESDLSGRRAGPYQLTRLLGHGGMGSVYLAVRDDQFQKQVAIKLLKRGMDTDFMLARFRQERQILANLEHPFIARLLDGGATDDGLPYFAMEYVDGVPITRYCAEKKLSIPERLRLFRMVCEAVQHAHQHLVVHRDIKPSNILTTPEGVPKLLDFGIAKVLNPDVPDGSTLTKGEFRMLTPEYASPEQVKGWPISTASDVYSLGAVLYELLAGERAHQFPSGSPADLEKIICDAEPEKPSVVAPRPARRRIEGDLDNIVLMAMRKEPERRYASVAALSEDLQRHLDGLPIQAQSDRWGYRAGKFVRRNRVAVGAAALIALSLIAGIVATTIQAQRAERRFGVARQLARAVMNEVGVMLAQIPGATAARASMLQNVVRYLDELAQDPGSDPNFDLELADAYREVGSLEAHPTRQNLGQPNESLRNYAKALVLYQGVYSRLAAPTSARAHALSGLIGTNIEAGDVETRMGNRPAALGRLGDAEALSKEAVARDPALLVAGTAVYLYFRLGDVAMRAGKPEEAIEQFRLALAVSQKWDAEEHTLNSRSTLRGAYANLAGAQLQAGDLAGALENYQTALREVEKTLRLPDATVYERSTLASAHSNIADVLGHPDDLNYGDRAAAISHYATAIEILEAIAQADRNDVRAQADLAAAYRSQGAILLDGRPVDALQRYQQALAISERLSRIDPSSIPHRRDLGVEHMGIGEALHLLQRDREALPHLTAALPLIESAIAGDPTQLSWIGLAARVHRDIGTQLLPGDRGAALEHYQQALALTAKLVERAPANRYFERHHADSLEALGRYYGRGPEARLWLDKSLAIWQEWKIRNIAVPYAGVRERQVTALLAASGQN